MERGLIINHISNEYQVEICERVYRCTARGKFKKENIKPTVGDRVNIDILDEQNFIGIINEIEPRINYIKRPKLANLTRDCLCCIFKSSKTRFIPFK
ncbi:MAG: hypothetical protein Q4G05_06055 [Clostridia bacterium]|nr:hypothetical protein [Clostridia bacterium]